MVTRDPAPVEEFLTEVLGLKLADRFPGIDQYGLGTAFFPIGNQFLEVVHSAVSGTAADRLIDKRGGDTGFIVMLETLNLAAVEAVASSLEIRVVDSFDNETGRYLHFHPSDVGGTLLGVYELKGADAGAANGPWMYGGDHWKSAHRNDFVSGVGEVVIECKASAHVAEVWSQIAGGDVTITPSGPMLRLTGGRIRFVTGTENRGITALSLWTTDVETVLSRLSDAGPSSASGHYSVSGLTLDFIEI